MKLSTSLKDVQGAASLCIKCAGCTYAEWPDTYTLCPIYSRDECFTFCAGGLLYLVKALADKQIDFSQSIAELALTCTSCGACDSRCGIIRSQAPHVNPLDVIRLLRYESAKRGFIPEGLARKIYNEIKKEGDYGQKNSFEVSDKILSDRADTVLFAECYHSKAGMQIGEAAARLLEKLGSPVALFSEKGCCGSTLYDFGFWDQLESLVKRNWKKMKTLGAKEFVFINPHCQEFVVKRYPELLPGFTGIKSRHFSQLLADAFRDGRLRSKRAGTVKVSYHDPCYLGRGLGIYDAPRQVLSSLSGVKLVEMARNRQNSFCCGARALGNYFPRMAEYTVRERMKEFHETGAELLITACPYCKEQFQKVMPAKEKDRIKDLLELVDERTG